LADLLAQARDAHPGLTGVCHARAVQLDAEHSRVRAELDAGEAADCR
jgi:hypothetical protein